MEYRIQDLIDIGLFQELLDRLNDAFCLTTAIVDNESNVITASGWQDVCMKFHRANKDSEFICKKSDRYITEHLQEADPFVIYKCLHGLVDAATPIIVEGKHLANFFIGQAFLEKPDIDFFKKQAEKYGYDEEKFLEAVSKVPVISEEELQNRLGFIRSMTEILAKMGHERLKQIELLNELQKKNRELSNSVEQSIYALSKASEIRDRYTAGHQKRVRQLACAIASDMGLAPETINNISLGALVHDIGKIYIPSDILNKPGQITDLEYELIEEHPKHGYDIVKDINLPWQIPVMIYQHHERLDGSGYPEGIKGDGIIIESRILSVAEVVEAMSSHRPYRPNLGIDAALNEIRAGRGTKFDSEVVDACVGLFTEKGFAFTE